MSGRLRALWSWVYGVVLIAIGIGAGFFVAYRIVHPELLDSRDPLWIVLYQYVALGFISLGAVVIGLERIRRREIRALRPYVKPDEALMDKFGPAKGSFWKRKDG